MGNRRTRCPAHRAALARSGRQFKSNGNCTKRSSACPGRLASSRSMGAELSNLSTILSSEEEKLLACVHCGLCLEACPKYVATADENDSPRGRIYVMRAVKELRLDVDSAAFEPHFDSCLGCRACEAACPAGVQYGQL